MNTESIFIDIPEVNELEKEEKWYAACEKLYQKWKQDEENLEIALRLLWECWYLDVEDACFVHFTDKETEEVHRMFRDAYRYGEGHFRDNGKYRWLTGYMLSICSFLMYDITIYHEEPCCKDIHGIDLADGEAEYRMKNVGDAIPDEMFWREQNREIHSVEELKKRKRILSAKKLTLEERTEKQRIEAEREKINTKIKEYFPNDSLIDQYFQEIYSLYEYDFCQCGKELKKLLKLYLDKKGEKIEIETDIDDAILKNVLIYSREKKRALKFVLLSEEVTGYVLEYTLDGIVIQRLKRNSPIEERFYINMSHVKELHMVKVNDTELERLLLG